MSTPLYSSNFSKLYLLSNNLISIKFKSCTIKLKIPTMKMVLDDDKIINFLTLLSNKDGFWSNNGYFIANNAYEFLLGIHNFIDKEFFKNIWEYIFPNLILDNRSIKCGDIDITPEELSIVVDMLLVGCNFKDYEDFEKSSIENTDSELSEWDKKLKENEERIKKTKSKSNSKHEIKMDEVFISIIHIFPQFTINSLMEMNYFSIMYLFKWSQKIIVQRVNDIAAGNGIAKNYKPLFD